MNNAAAIPEFSHRRNALCFAVAHGTSAFAYEFLTFFMTLHLYQLTGRAVDMGVLLAVSFVPRLFSPFYGNLTDRLPRRTLFVMTCLLAAACTLMLAGQRQVAGIYVIWLMVSTLAMILLNLRTAIMPQVVPRHRYASANAVMLILLNLARLAAPLLGACLAQRQPVVLVFSFAAATYGLAALAATPLRLPPAEATAHAQEQSVLSSLREGLTTIVRSHDLATLGTICVIWRLCLGFQGALMIVYVQQGLHGGTSEFAMMSIALALGSIAGSALGPGVARRASPRRLMIVGINMHFACVAALGLITDYSLALATAAFANLVLYCAAVAVHSIRDSATNNERRGRVYGCITALTAPPALISVLVGGFLADRWGVRPVFAMGGITAIVACIPMFIALRQPRAIADLR